jgi:hypothetical protein
MFDETLRDIKAAIKHDHHKYDRIAAKGRKKDIKFIDYLREDSIVTLRVIKYV